LMGSASQYEVVIRLADEGVPVRAIARSTSLPSDQIREILTDALQDGRLLELPREDWPPGFPRDQRVNYARATGVDPIALLYRVQKLFRCARSEAILLLALVQNDQVSKVRDDMAYKSVDVYVCNLRKILEPLKITINTLWGYGYRITPKDRRKLLDMIVTAVQPPEKLDACA